MATIMLIALDMAMKGVSQAFLAWWRAKTPLVFFLLSISASLQAAPTTSASTPGLVVRIANLGTSLELKETAAPANLPNSPELRYMTTPDGEVVAMTNRLLVVVSDLQMLAGILSLPQVVDHAPLAELESSRIELLETADIPTMLALLPVLTKMPGVISVQPDLSQNVTRHDAGVFFDWEHFSLADAIGLRNAWRLTQGRGVRVAIIDTGIDLRHPDLRGLKLAASFDVQRRSSRSAPENDKETHGTLVAGVIFARHNELGIDGVAPQAELIAVRLMSGWTSTSVLALEAAVKAGADIINCSWTFPLMLDPVAHMVDDFAKQGRHGRGGLLVVSAGNLPVEISRPEQFPFYANLLTVTAVDHHGAPSDAAYGPGVFIAAPGLLKSTSNNGNGFRPLGGTSAAAAVVSGVIALMLSVNPQLDRVQVKQLLANTASRRPSDDFVGERSSLLGGGRIDAGRAVAAALAARQKAES